MRPSWDEYFMSIAETVASRSTCLRRKVGAVIVRDKHIVSTGYNGAPQGIPHCSELGCLRQELNIPSGERHEMCRGSHAEINAIVQAAAVGSSTKGGELYCTTEPCSFCTKAIINAGIFRIVYLHSYPDSLARELRRTAKIEVVCLKDSPNEDFLAAKSQYRCLQGLGKGVFHESSGSVRSFFTT